MWADLPKESKVVSKVRHALASQVALRERPVLLNGLALGMDGSLNVSRSYSLLCAHDRSDVVPCGFAARHRAYPIPKREPVECYVAAYFENGMAIEAVRYRHASPDTYRLYARGEAIGSVTELFADRDVSKGGFRQWIRKFVRSCVGSREWSVVVNGNVIGRILLSYPITARSHIVIRLTNGQSLPIRVYREGAPDYVVPLRINSDHVMGLGIGQAQWLELYFLVNLLWRMEIVAFDFERAEG
jgi:hypothetical protein